MHVYGPGVAGVVYDCHSGGPCCLCYCRVRKGEGLLEYNLILGFPLKVPHPFLFFLLSITYTYYVGISPIEIHPLRRPSGGRTVAFSYPQSLRPAPITKAYPGDLKAGALLGAFLAPEEPRELMFCNSKEKWLGW